MKKKIIQILKKLIPKNLKKNALLRKALAFLASAYYGFPAKKLILIGVTGTTGKTSTTFMIKSILEEAGIKTGLIGTAGYYLGSEVIPNRNEGPGTTPDPFLLHSLLKQMVEKNIKVVVMEVSSFGLMYWRHYGLHFQAAILTNIAYNHHVALHGSMENYLKEKLKLFKFLSQKSIAILPQESEYFDIFQKATKAKIITYGLSSASNIWLENNTVHYQDGIRNETFDLFLKIPGTFNRLNALAAIGGVSFLNLSFEDIKRGLEKLEVIPGRLEPITSQAPFQIIVDKANTPLAFQNIIEFLKNEKTASPAKINRCLAVYGTFAESPQEERKQLAQLATNFFDLVIFTEDDPMNEAKDKAPQDFLNFVRQNKISPDKYLIIPNREEAIRTALKNAKPHDLVIILGRGNEQFMLYQNKKIPFDDREITKKILKELQYLP